MEPRYQNIEVQLVGLDRNAGSIIGRVTSELRKNGVSSEEQDEFRKQATSGDYDNVLQTVMDWVTIY